MGITIVGLGPGDGKLMTREAWDVLSSAESIYLRTERHPAVAELPAGPEIVGLDHYYDMAESFEEVYRHIVNELMAHGRDKNIVYAVPGHPNMGESTVSTLMDEARREAIPIRVVAGLSFVEPVLSAIGLEGLNGLQLYDAIELLKYQYPPINPDSPLLLGQVYSSMLAGDLKILLGAVYPDEHPVKLVHSAGTQYELVESIALFEIDRSLKTGHLTSLYVPPLPRKSTLPALAETVAVLRGPEGCPWDQEQTPESMRAGFLEEVSEVMDAIEEADQVALEEELGDVMYHLVMQVQMAAETDEFKLSDVIAGIESKLKRRHPHVWGDWEVADTAEVLHNWELLKKDEKADASGSILDGVPRSLPALARSQKIQERVRKVGFDWPHVNGVYAKLDEEIAELKSAQGLAEQQIELGDALFVMANIANWLDIDAEISLRGANQRFARRFRRLEKLVSERGLNWAELDLTAMDALWDEVKETLAKEG